MMDVFVLCRRFLLLFFDDFHPISFKPIVSSTGACPSLDHITAEVARYTSFSRTQGVTPAIRTSVDLKWKVTRCTAKFYISHCLLRPYKQSGLAGQSVQRLTRFSPLHCICHSRGPISLTAALYHVTLVGVGYQQFALEVPGWLTDHLWAALFLPRSCGSDAISSGYLHIFPIAIRRQKCRNV